MTAINRPLFLHPSGEFISDQIRRTRTYYEVDLLHKISSLCNVKVFIDIGANIGNHSHFFRSTGATGVAVEPCLYNFALLKRNVPDFTLLNCAMGSGLTDQFAELVSFESSRGNAYLSHNFKREQKSWGENATRQRVEVHTLDSFHFTNISLIKINAEGSELDILKGAILTLRRDKPLIWIELLDDNTLEIGRFPYRRADIMRFFYSLGYFEVSRLDATNYVFSQ